MMLLALTLSALAQEAPSDAELYQRLMEEPAAESQIRSASAPWWMWPMGLLGALGAAGVVLRTRKSEGIPGDINVLSRAGLSRTASLAMIEVTGTDGAPRRMLIGVGGGAPRLVADLSARPVPERAEASWFDDLPASEPEPVRAPPPRRAEPAAPVGQRLSVTTPEDPMPEPARQPDPLRAPHAARAYGAVKPKVGVERLNLVAEVLAERGSDEPAAETQPGWSDPWAKNFEALLGRRSV